MIEVFGDLWTYTADVRVITTNGTVKKNGEAVMGRGCAAEAKEKFPKLSYQLGANLKQRGNNPVFFLSYGLITFPVKWEWYQKANLELIKHSALLLAAFNLDEGFSTIVMPRPGCGNGGLKWEDVKPVIAPILDDRFHVITWK